MCVLCGESLTHLHWTDESRHASGVGGSRNGDEQGALRRERMRRASAANALLGFYGLKLDRTPGRDYQLSDRKGRSVLVGDLGALWPEAKRLCGRTIDPLDPDLLASLSEERQ